MKNKRCKHGHVHDTDQYSVCPNRTGKRSDNSVWGKIFGGIVGKKASGKKWSTDYEGRCGNCHRRIQDNDKYCRYCGTRRGEGKYKPYQTIIQCIYGPRPVKRVRKCTKCQMTWETQLMVDNEDYCPECGAPSKIVFEGADHDVPPSTIVGHLACVKGPNMGTKYPIHSGINSIGRAQEMDICISSDPCVSRINAAVIIYDWRNKVFLFKPGEGRNRVCVNGEVAINLQVLKPRDILTIGESELMFVP